MLTGWKLSADLFSWPAQLLCFPSERLLILEAGITGYFGAARVEGEDLETS